MEEDDPGGGSGGEPRSCCARMSQQLRDEFGEKMKEMEDRMQEKQEKLQKYVEDLKEIITVREEQVIATMATVKDREETIASLRKDISERDMQIEALQGRVDIMENQRAAYRKRQRQELSQRGEQSKEQTMEQIFGGVRTDRFYTVTFKEEGAKRKLCPYKLEAGIASKMKGNPKTITSNGRNSILIEVSTPNQSSNIEQWTEVLNQEVVVQKHGFFNEVKGLIYIHNNDIGDLASFSKGLQERSAVADVERARFIKPRNPRTVALLVRFKGDTIPEYVSIPGEYIMTKVYEYKERPMRCYKCQKYGHTHKRCSAAENVCGKCTKEHPTEQCTSDEKKCANCQGEHEANDPTCDIRKGEENILAMEKEKKLGVGKR